MLRFLVIIPTYDEAENIPKIIPEVLRQSTAETDFSVLVVDDNSPDGTARLVQNLSNEKVFLIRRNRKMGLGTAYIEGFKFAIDREFDYVFEMDADFSHDPNYLPHFVEQVRQGFDMVIGSRYLDGISITNWPIRRLILSYAANLYSRLITGLKVKDTTAGFVCYRVDILKQIDLERVQSSGYAFQIEMKYLLTSKGVRTTEIPIIFMDRRAGRSKLSRWIILEACWIVWKLRWKSILAKLGL